MTLQDVNHLEQDIVVILQKIRQQQDIGVAISGVPMRQLIIKQAHSRIDNVFMC
jgi:phospholipid N-methyltransferase